MARFSDDWRPEPQVDLPPADRMGRLIAAALDEGVWVGLASVLGFLFSGGLITAVGLGFNVVQDVPFGGGTSLGRRVTGQVLVDHRGMECTPARGAARNALRMILWVGGCFLPFLLDLGLLLIHPKGLTCADLILGTQVVDRPHATLRPDQLEARQRKLLEG
jgi:uncharacterized RDD family membrane protein YckC